MESSKDMESLAVQEWAEKEGNLHRALSSKVLVRWHRTSQTRQVCT